MVFGSDAQSLGRPGGGALPCRAFWASLERRPVKIEEVVARAYVVFAEYNLRAGLIVCSCCVTSQERERLTKIPLRELSFEDMFAYLNSAHGFDAIAAHQLKYFLPRFLELCIPEVWPYMTTERTFTKLKSAGFPEAFLTVEAEVVRSFFRALFDACLAGRRTEGAEDLLAAFANAGDSIGGYLERWNADRSESASRAIAEVIQALSFRGEGTHRFFLTNTWEDGEPRRLRDQFLVWLLSPAMCKRMEAAFFAATNDQAARLFSAAQAILWLA